jgi:hypothetical protein
LVVRGSEGGTLFLNSPWLTRDSELLFADILMTSFEIGIESA